MISGRSRRRKGSPPEMSRRRIGGSVETKRSISSSESSFLPALIG